MQQGRCVGTLPKDADRLDNLQREGDAWIAGEHLAGC